MIERKVDELGRIVIPIDFRNALGIESGDKITISFLEGEGIILQKSHPTCAFCKQAEINKIKLVTLNGRSVCPSCLATLNQQNS